MDDSLAPWLALREPADLAARSSRLTQIAAEVTTARVPMRALDLATGTGANIRYLMEQLAERQHWVAVDRRENLLATLMAKTSAWGSSRGYDVERHDHRFVIRNSRRECVVETCQRDLGALDHPDLFADRDLITASALLDLVSDG